MEISRNHKKKENASIFSSLKDIEKSEIFSDLEFNLSKLKQNVSLLGFYGTKVKINSKKIKNKFLSSPKKTQTEPNTQYKTSKNINTEKNFRELIESNDNPVNSLNNQIRNKVKPSKSNIFMTDINSKRKKVKKILNSTNYKTNEEINKKSRKKLPSLINQNINSTPEKSLIESKISNKINTSRNRLLNTNKTVDKEQFPKIPNYIKMMKKDNNKIKKNLHKGMEKFSIMEWYMETRFKYAQYKYGIAEIQKYFMDLKAYGKPEEEEIEKRKTFFDHVEDIINDIHEVQQQKEIEKLNKKYGVEHDKKKILKSKNEVDEEDPKKIERIELSKALQEISKRQQKEKKKREEIENILFKCKQRVHSINYLDGKLQKNRRIYGNFDI